MSHLVLLSVARMKRLAPHFPRSRGLARVDDDHGFHYGRSRNGAEPLPSKFIHFHFHFKPFENYLEAARNKLRPYVDVSDIDALRSYTGPNGQVLHALLDGPDSYLGRFQECLRIHLPEFGMLMAGLGIEHELFQEDAQSMTQPAYSMTMTGSHARDTRRIEVFDPVAYYRRWLDVAQSGFDPLLHYVLLGVHEGRVLDC